MEGVHAQMQRHRKIIAPKFKTVLGKLEEQLGGKGVADWTKPNGGYFVSVQVMDGCAKRVVQLCKEAGVQLTGAGAAYPYGKDPRDSNIRVAPTYPLSPSWRLRWICSASACSLQRRKSCWRTNNQILKNGIQPDFRVQRREFSRRCLHVRDLADLVRILLTFPEDNPIIILLRPRKPAEIQTYSWRLCA